MKSPARPTTYLASIALALLFAQGCQTIVPPKNDGAIHGIVFDYDKYPVNGARLTLTQGEQTWTAQSDAQGRFALSPLGPGNFILEFSKEQYEPRSWPILVNSLGDIVYIQVTNYWQFLDQAVQALGRKEWGEAEGYLARASTIQKESATALFLEGTLAAARGDIEAAIGKLERATQIDATSPYLWLYLADLYAKIEGGRDKEIGALKKYLELRDDPVVGERVGGANRD